MKKGTWAVVGAAAGYLFAPYIKKGIDWVKVGLINLKKKLDEEAAKEEVPTPEEETVEEEEAPQQ